MDAYKIIQSHISTERTTRLRQNNNEYVFRVDKRANKYQISLAIQQAFKVGVDSVRTLIVPGKKRRMGRFEGKTPSWKKAIVRLKKGEVISALENV